MGWIESRRETQKTRALEAYRNARAAAVVAARQAAEATTAGRYDAVDLRVTASLAQGHADQCERDAALLGALPADGAAGADDADPLVRLRQAEKEFRLALEDARAALEGALHETSSPKGEGGWGVH